MNFLKLTPEQKRQRKIDVIKEYHKRVRRMRKNETFKSIRIELANAYGYAGEDVVEQIIIRDRRQKESQKK